MPQRWSRGHNLRNQRQGLGKKSEAKDRLFVERPFKAKYRNGLGQGPRAHFL